MTTADIERTLMGSLLMGDAVPSSLGLSPQQMTDPLCRKILTLCLEMEQRKEPVDLVGVCMADETLDAAQASQIMQERCMGETFIERNVRLLQDAAIWRAYRALLQDALAQSGDACEQIARLRERLDRLIAQSARDGQPGRSMLELMVDVLEEIERPKEEAQPVATGIGKLDECLTGGFRPGDLAVVAALTSVGKSAMLSFMMRNAAEAGRRILLVSCEMSDAQNAERFMASISGVPLEQIIARSPLTGEQNVKVSEGMERYHPENIQVISSGTQTVGSIRRAAVRMKESGGLDLIVVDYLQRLRSERTGGNRADEIGSIAAALKALAVDLDVPVLTAAQFNREAARARREAQGQEDEGVPALHQLRDSSQIEDEANTVIVLDEPVRTFGRIRNINAHVVKNRSGTLGRTRLLFDGQTMRYAEA